MEPTVFAVVDGVRWEGAEALGQVGLEVSVRQRRYPGGRAHAIAVRNRSARCLRLDRVGVRLSGPSGRAPRRWRVFVDRGSCGWCGVRPLEALAPDPRLVPVHRQRGGFGPDAAPACHRSDLQTVLWDALQGDAVLVGFLRQRHGRNGVDVVPNRHRDDIAHLEAWQEFGTELAAGARQELDLLVVADGHDPYRLLEAFGAAVQRHCGRAFVEPPVVGMMTWYGYRTAIDERIILENAALVAELFGGYPQPMRRVMLLDHGWQEDANWGTWVPDARRFPHGMAWLGRRLARQGLELGLWYTPFCVTDNAPQRRELEPLLARDEEDRPRGGLASVWGQLPGHPVSRTLAFLDGGLAQVQRRWQRELARMRRWGCAYWKLDFFALQTGASRQRRLGVGDLYHRTWSGFRAAAGEAGHLAPCSCGTNIQLGYLDSVRIGSDIGNAGHWPGAWDGFRYGLGTIAALWYKHRRFWVNDPDSIQIGKGCSLGEARVRATMVSLSGGHLMLSEDLRTLDQERLEIIRRILPAMPQAARPLDLFEEPFPDGYPALWQLTLPAPAGGTTALAVFNLTNSVRRWTITPRMLGIHPARRYLALEWWSQRWLGRQRGPLELEVPAEDVAVVHAGIAGRVPSVMSVSHHISGGYIVERAVFDERTGLLEGVLTTRPGLRLVLFGHCPPAWALARAATFHGALGGLGGWQQELVTTGPRTSFAVPFDKRARR